MKWICIGALSLGILFGICAAQTQQISYLAFAPNVIGLLIGALIIFFSENVEDWLRNHFSLATTAGSALLAATLFSPGAEGIHRWVSVSSINLNVSFIVVPIFCFLILSLDQLFVVVLMGLTTVIYLYQPDASQGSAFGIAAIGILFLKEKMEFKYRVSAIFIGFVCVICPWFMEDRLEAVPQVEQILRIAVAATDVFVVGMILVLGALFAPFLWVGFKSREKTVRILTFGLVLYWFTGFLVTELGSYPVPVIGAGAAAVLGWSISYSLILATKPSRQT